MQRVTLVVVGNRCSELDGIGGIGLQRIGLKGDLNATATHSNGGFLLHCGRGVELLLLILKLNILVEGHIDALIAEIGGVEHGCDCHYVGCQRVARATRRVADRSTTRKKCTRKEQEHSHRRQTRQGGDMLLSEIHHL